MSKTVTNKGRLSFICMSRTDILLNGLRYFDSKCLQAVNKIFLHHALYNQHFAYSTTFCIVPAFIYFSASSSGAAFSLPASAFLLRGSLFHGISCKNWTLFSIFLHEGPVKSNLLHWALFSVFAHWGPAMSFKDYFSPVFLFFMSRPAPARPVRSKPMR